jgi:hypothetical protein
VTVACRSQRVPAGVTVVQRGQWPPPWGQLIAGAASPSFHERHGLRWQGSRVWRWRGGIGSLLRPTTQIQMIGTVAAKRQRLVCEKGSNCSSHGASRATNPRSVIHGERRGEGQGRPGSMGVG